MYVPADIDGLNKCAENLDKKISALKDNLEGSKNHLDVYSDIAKTYYEISKDNYIERLVEEEKREKNIEIGSERSRFKTLDRYFLK